MTDSKELIVGLGVSAAGLLRMEEELEELKASNQELQSVNDELRAINQELKVKLEEQTQASNDVRNLIDSTDIGTVLLDRAGRIKLFTPRARDIFSLTPGDRGRPLDDIKVQLVDVNVQADVERVLERLERVEREVTTSDGKWYLMRVVPSRTDDDRIDGVVMTFVEITERKRNVELIRQSEERVRRALEIETVGVITDLQRTTEALRDADRRKNEFLATLAHELRNPLAPISTSLQVLKKNVGDSALATRARDTIARQVAHMVRLAEDLVEVSRITLGKIEIRREVVDLRDALRAAVEGVSPGIEASSHELRVEMPEEPLAVNGDPVRLAQVFLNLLNNSLRYTPDGGLIWLRATREGDEWARVSVRDSGIGIAEEVLPHVFEMFTQGGDVPAGHARSGLGIGLTLVRTLVDGHGGSVQVLSEGRGKGTEVVVRLPLTSAQEHEAAEEPLPIDLRGHSVLVVDDNRDAADSLGELLRISGADVDVVYSGAAALAAHAGKGHRVAFVDLGMPVMDGFELARRVRASDGNTTLVAVTGWGQDHDRASTHQAGFNHHLVKPVDPARLREVLASIVDAKA